MDKIITVGQSMFDELQFNALLAGKAIGIEVESNLTYDMVDSSVDNVWSILLMTGYLTPVEYMDDNQYIVKLPNKEIRSLFESTIISKFKRTLDQNKQRALVRALWDKDATEAAKYLSNLLDTTISCFDFHEIYYHAFLTGVFSGMGYIVKSNKEAGDGRADIVIRDNPSDRAMVIETKRTTNPDEMDTKCDEALQQITEHRYTDPLREEYPTVVCVGITFCKKTALVKIMS